MAVDVSTASLSPERTKLWHSLYQEKITSFNVSKGVWDGADDGSAVKHWPESLRKEEVLI